MNNCPHCGRATRRRLRYVYRALVRRTWRRALRPSCRLYEWCQSNRARRWVPRRLRAAMFDQLGWVNNRYGRACERWKAAL